jgi:hypothetical protein
VRQGQEQRPIDCFGRVQVPMPIGRLHQREQVPEGEYFCSISTIISFLINISADKLLADESQIDFFLHEIPPTE